MLRSENTTTKLTIVVGKGRILKAAIPLLQKIGCEIPKDLIDSDKTLFDIGKLNLLKVRNWDVGTYIAEGVAHVGIMGLDIISECNWLEVYTPLDLGISHCKLILALPSGKSLPRYPQIATRFVNTAERWFAENNIPGRVIKLDGILERAPSLGLADGIIDQLQTGKSLRDNGLEVYAELMESSAHLVVNKAAARMQMAQVESLIEELRLGVNALNL